MKPIIGIVGRASVENIGRPAISVLENYRQAIIKAGGIPILILPPQKVEYENIIPKDVSKLDDEDIEILNAQLKLLPTLFSHILIYLQEHIFYFS